MSDARNVDEAYERLLSEACVPLMHALSAAHAAIKDGDFVMAAGALHPLSGRVVQLADMCIMAGRICVKDDEKTEGEKG